MDSGQCRTFLIEDIPALEDAFASSDDLGPHQRVADAIAELIESSEAGGKVIGLEGSWSAGKSTVVNLLRKRIEHNSNFTVIAFDAWAHEGDPLRRTYLETLIHHLQQLKWVDVNSWDKALREIANRKKVKTTRIVPKTTGLGTWFAIALMLVPLGAVSMGAALRSGVVLEIGRPVRERARRP